MTSDYSHLNTLCQSIIGLPIKERIGFIHEGKWVNHSAGVNIRNRIKSSLFLPNNEQAMCMMIVGAGGVGKSSLLDRVVKDCESWAHRQGVPAPYLQLKLPSDPTLKNNISALCNQCGLSTHSVTKDALPKPLELLFKARKIRMLLVDEFNHLLAVNRIEARKNLNFFKLISGPPMSLILVAFGTHDAMHAIRMDIQLSSRFQVFELEQWRPDEEFRSFLASYEKCLPLMYPSNLASKEIVDYFVNQLEPTTRNIVNRLKWAAMTAILEGSERISIDVLERSDFLPDLSSVYEQ